MRTSNAFRPYSTAGSTRLEPEGTSLSFRSSATRTSCLIPVDSFRLAELMLRAERGLHLVGRGRDHEPQTHRDERDEHRVVQDDADSPWDADPGEALDARSKRS